MNDKVRDNDGLLGHRDAAGQETEGEGAAAARLGDCRGTRGVGIMARCRMNERRGTA